MCGIIGSINVDFDTKKANQLLGHRGPDERISLKIENVLLHHLRLTILDAEGGKQPMSIEDRYHMIFNGEIYNHLEVREELKLNCKSRSDSETVLRAYQKVGKDCLNYFDGMFALAIYDNLEKKIFLARDRAGKKPLYLYKKESQILFASEQNVLKGLLPTSINSDHINDYLQGGMIKSMTAYNEIIELTSGTYTFINTKTLDVETSRWWDINEHYNKPVKDSYDEAKSNVDTYLRTAVKRRLDTSDLEVGTFLSGGIDSGLVTAIASESNPNLKAFTISFDGVFDESDLARLVAKKYNVEHEVIPIAFDKLTNDFEKIILSYGEPFSDSSAIPSYYVSEAAKKHLTVILNGDGADEIFGGYRRYVPYAKYDFYEKGKLLSNLSKAAKTILPHPHNKKSKYNYIYRLIDIMTKDKDQIYWSSTSDTFSGYFDKFHNSVSENITGIFSLMDEKYNLSGLQKQMNLDFEIILGGTLLKKMDIATMANSLEGRSPFMSKELLEYAPSINDKYKVNGITTKRILRDLANDYLPNDLVHQPKRGFEIPLKKWIDDDLKGFIDIHLMKKDRYINEHIDPKFVNDLIARKINVSDEKRAKMLYKLLVLEIWANSL